MLCLLIPYVICTHIHHIIELTQVYVRTHVGNCFLPDCSLVMAEHSNTTVSACFQCMCDVLGNEKLHVHTKTWNAMDQFISLFLVCYVSKSSFIAS